MQDEPNNFTFDPDELVKRLAQCGVALESEAVASWSREEATEANQWIAGHVQGLPPILWTYTADRGPGPNECTAEDVADALEIAGDSIALETLQTLTLSELLELRGYAVWKKAGVEHDVPVDLLNRVRDKAQRSADERELREVNGEEAPAAAAADTPADVAEQLEALPAEGVTPPAEATQEVPQAAPDPDAIPNTGDLAAAVNGLLEKASADERGEALEEKFNALPVSLSVAANRMQGVLVKWLRDELVATGEWPKMNEERQERVLSRARETSKSIVEAAVQDIANRGAPSMYATLAKLAVGDKLQATLAIPARHHMRHRLLDAQGEEVLIVFADPEKFMGGTATVRAEPDQRPLLPPAAEASQAEAPPPPVSPPPADKPAKRGRGRPPGSGNKKKGG